MRPIDADALIERIEYSFYDNERVRIDTVTGTFLTEYCSPTIKVEPIKYGKWELKEFQIAPFGVTQALVCSNCGYDHEYDEFFDRCPRCGAFMIGRVKNE